MIDAFPALNFCETSNTHSYSVKERFRGQQEHQHLLKVELVTDALDVASTHDPRVQRCRFGADKAAALCTC